MSLQASLTILRSQCLFGWTVLEMASVGPGEVLRAGYLAMFNGTTARVVSQVPLDSITRAAVLVSGWWIGMQNRLLV